MTDFNDLYRQAVLQPDHSPEIFQRDLGEGRGTLEEFLLNALDEGGPRTFEKIIVANPRIPKSSEVRQSVLYNLAVEYGLDPSPATEYNESIQLEIILGSCVEAESYGLDPKMVLEKLDEIKSYMSENGIKSSYIGSDYRPSEIFGFVLTSLKAVKIYELVKEMYAEADRVENMTFEEWEAYRQGIKWSQSGKVYELRQQAESASKQFFSEINLSNSPSDVKGDELLQVMRQAPIVRDVAGNYSAQGSLASYIAFGSMIGQRNMFDAVRIVLKQ